MTDAAKLYWNARAELEQQYQPNERIELVHDGGATRFVFFVCFEGGPRTWRMIVDWGSGAGQRVVGLSDGVLRYEGRTPPNAWRLAGLDSAQRAWKDWHARKKREAEP